MYILLFLVIAIPFLISLYNLLRYPVLSKKLIQNPPSLTVVVPMRNESSNVEGFMNSILDIEYDNLNIIVVNDDSTDDTLLKLKRYTKTKKIQIIDLKSKPRDWKGKNWACMEASKGVKTDYILFTDADVRFDRFVLQSAIYELVTSNSDLLSLFPQQYSKNILSQININNMMYFLLSFLPLDLIYLSKREEFVASIGQFLLFNTNSYLKIGGHEAVKETINEDIAFGVLIKQQGLKLKSLLAPDMLKCNMYNGLYKSIKGFGKSFFSQFRKSPWIFILIILIVFTINILPLLLLPFNTVSIIFILMNILTYINISILSKQSVFLVFLYPLQSILFIYTGIYSYLRNDSLEWKGRIV